jgi:CheY-like chemotaxis protein
MEILPAMGYQPTEAVDGESALAILDQRQFDAVISDYMLPKMTGAELMHTIKAKSPGTVVIMITGYAPSIDGHEFGDADGYLMKPFRFDEIDKLLKKLPPPVR